MTTLVPVEIGQDVAALAPVVDAKESVPLKKKEEAKEKPNILALRSALHDAVRAVIAYLRDQPQHQITPLDADADEEEEERTDLLKRETIAHLNQALDEAVTDMVEQELGPSPSSVPCTDGKLCNCRSRMVMPWSSIQSLDEEEED